MAIDYSTKMFQTNLIPANLGFLALSLAAFAGPAAAAPIQVKVTSTVPRAYSADVSASDLLAGLTPVTTGWNTGNQASPRELSDGMHGGPFAPGSGDAVQGAWTTVGATATYDLGAGPNSGGYNLTSIQSIADWDSAGFGNQGWKVETKLAGATDFTTLATVSYQPIASGGGTTKVTLTDGGGTLASGVRWIRFTANSVNGGANSGAFIWREVDVFGGPATPDTAPPFIDSFVPANNETNASPAADLILTFNENIAIGTGNVTIRNLDANSPLLIPISDPRITVTGSTLTINPAESLSANTRHAIQIDPTAIHDLSGNRFVGIGDDLTWRFTTGQPDLTAPSIISLAPARGAIDARAASNLVATFNEDIAMGTGSITLRNLTAAAEIVITLPDSRISIAGAVLTINPETDLSDSTSYSVRIGSTAITDRAGNPFTGITDDETWNIITAATPLRIMCLGDSITAGYTDNPTWSVPYKFGYRGRLFNLLTDTRRYNFKFVGGSTEPWTGISGDPTRGGTYKPAFDLRDIGQDGHRGYGGKTASFLNSNILTWLATDDPDVILLKIGTNSQDQSGLDTLVDTITKTKPNLHLIVARIIPKYSYQQGIVDYNNYIRDTLLPKYGTLGRNVTLVDQYAPFLTDPGNLTSINQSLFANGINHPDNAGYDRMADVWFAGIEALGIAPATFASYISNPAFGLAPAEQGLDLDPDGDGIGNGLEAWFGTNPREFSKGIARLNKTGAVTTFTHPRNESLPADLSISYRWSTNLTDWYDSAAPNGPGGVPAVTITADTVGGTTTVTATATGVLDQVFLRAEVSRR